MELPPQEAAEAEKKTASSTVQKNMLKSVSTKQLRLLPLTRMQLEQWQWIVSIKPLMR
jgi:hypothetical protein